MASRGALPEDDSALVSVDLLDVLMVCVRGALAAQRYIALELLRVREVEAKVPDLFIMDQDGQTKKALLSSLHHAVSVDVKEQLLYKDGNAASDFVTTADFMTQAVLVQVLRAAFPELPFSVVGEEDEAASGATGRQAEHCVAAYYDALETIPHQAELEARVVGGARRVASPTWEKLRARVGVFIDPIDGTNCFVEGHWEVPLTLVGITLDGVPVAGVVNRVLRCNVAQVERRGSSASLSYAFNLGAAGPFIVHEGQRVAPLLSAPTAVGACSTLRVASSSTTGKKCLANFFRKLRPIEMRGARGAGNKLMFLVASMLEGSPALRSCDVFFSPENTIKKWDTCAPHALLLALGGELYTQCGGAIRYPLHGEEQAALPNGVVGVTRWSKVEVSRRLGWPRPSL
ncbi:putative inositol polyphosphate 1-phosphatase [Trypanosoma grayi]|uniref:putative inositol polyphosphate 1-phosphatase n=1 Tax=Trypanosoma grayi TaxID=71804 RepID=UPI0004F4B22D|nr:putative inositol polyphosphate 1-phosphatase [Trypanosoma grayi]KEG07765.1 putative inositol polyphosphate 1-phosphatase [Trypanosoma grayi]